MVSITLGSPYKMCGLTYTISHNDYNNIGLCSYPCTPVQGGSLPPFLKDNYYSESGTNGPTVHINFYSLALLWDGKGCSADSRCYAQMRMPKLHRKTLQQSSDKMNMIKIYSSKNPDFSLSKI